MTVTIGVPNDNTAAGWSTITPVIVEGWASQQGTGYSGTGTRFIYVDPAGSNTNPGTLASPKATPGSVASGGLSALRSGKPDWLLLKNGSTFANASFDILSTPGQDANNPIVIAGYDPANPQVPNPGTGGARPIIQVTSSSSNGLGIGLWSLADFIAIMGIEFYCPNRDPANGSPPSEKDSHFTGVSVLAGSTWLLFEDCKISWFEMGMDFEPYPNFNSNVRIRRCVVTDSYSTSSNIAGILAGPWNDLFLLDGNVWDHNGWNATIAGAGATGFRHNLYFNGYAVDGDLSSLPNCPITAIYNIFANDGAGSNFRAGINGTNNLWVHNPNSHNIMVPGTGNSSTLTNNVYVEGYFSTAPSIDASPFNVSAQYKGDAYNLGSIVVNNNLVCNSLSTGGSGYTMDNGSNNVTLSNNILYKWNSSDPSVGISYTIGGIFSVGSIVAGSGYTDRSMAISAADPATNTVTVVSTAAIDINGYCWIDAGGINQVVNTHPINATQVKIYNVELTTTTAGTLYYPYHQVPATGGSGSGATVDIIVKGTAVAAVLLTGCEGVVSQQLDSPGQNYLANDTGLSASGGPDGFGGGSSFTFNVTAIAIVTDSGNNTIDPTGSGSHPTWPHPERTVSLYAQQVLGIGGGTYDNFLTLARTQSKASWNVAYTADAVNDWIREGFGIFETADQVLMPQTHMGHQRGHHGKR